MALSLVWDWSELVSSITTSNGTIKNMGNARLLCTTTNNTNYQFDALDSLETVCPSLKKLLESAISLIESNTVVVPLIAVEQLEMQAYSDLKRAQDATRVLEHKYATLTDNHLFTLSINGHLEHYLVAHDCSYVRKHKLAPDLLGVLRSLSKYNQMIFDSHQDSTADLLHIWQVKHKDDFCERIAKMIEMLGGMDFTDSIRQYILKDIGVQG